MLPLYLNLELDVLFFHLFITDLITFPDHFYVLSIDHGNTYVRLNATNGEFCFYTI